MSVKANWGGAVQEYSVESSDHNPYNIQRVYINNAHHKNPHIQSNSLESTQSPSNPKSLDSQIDPQTPTEDKADTTKALQLIAPQIDYIIFMDSDDYWAQECLEECVKVSDGVDVVWFDLTTINDGKFIYQGYSENSHTQIQKFKHSGLPTNTQVTAQELISHAKKEFLIFAFQGIIDFRFLQRIQLQFINDIYSEDVFFGLMLFSQAHTIYLLDKALYYYCINPQSSSKYDTNMQKQHLPVFIQELYDAFGNAYDAREYYAFYSTLTGALALIEFIQSHPQNPNIQMLKTNYASLLVGWILGLLPSKDPWHIFTSFPKLAPYLTKNINLGKLSGFKKFCITHPRFLPLLRLVIIISRKVRDILKPRKDSTKTH